MDHTSSSTLDPACLVSTDTLARTSSTDFNQHKIFNQGCCISDEDVPQRRKHFVHGTRIRLWPPSRVEPTYPSDVSNRVIMEVVPCVFPEQEEELSVGKVRLVLLCLR
ncbi:hypothetical protein I79_010336 [Cricetulus griseus]|uniref:Uncharacterized protein n=1 Tax=Cricetulus griseus TaxID=10029 RepID=G3HI69_CRIGR|nr:hypothetical protein I79_010336 [Cricetulus griseus]